MMTSVTSVRICETLLKINTGNSALGVNRCGEIPIPILYVGIELNTAFITQVFRIKFIFLEIQADGQARKEI